ncbi:MAG: hypothetical protein LAO03_10325 [Acidobacteriia bacterium]|nr:hypothetical protein [Terriglobia bacterium]
MKLRNLQRLAVSAAMTTALGGAMLVSMPRAYADADDHRECQEKVERAESRLDQAIRKHGERSHQADQQRRNLNAERERCWNRYHGWWNGQEKRWHTDRDWDRDHDRDDHDRDHDRDDHH